MGHTLSELLAEEDVEMGELTVLVGMFNTMLADIDALKAEIAAMGLSAEEQAQVDALFDKIAANRAVIEPLIAPAPTPSPSPTAVDQPTGPDGAPSHDSTTPTGNAAIGDPSLATPTVDEGAAPGTPLDSDVPTGNAAP